MRVMRSLLIAMFIAWRTLTLSNGLHLGVERDVAGVQLLAIDDHLGAIRPSS
jgi:hypothetical protein